MRPESGRFPALECESLDRARDEADEPRVSIHIPEDFIRVITGTGLDDVHKPGGLQRLAQLAWCVDATMTVFVEIQVECIAPVQRLSGICELSHEARINIGFRRAA